MTDGTDIERLKRRITALEAENEQLKTLLVDAKGFSEGTLRVMASKIADLRKNQRELEDARQFSHATLLIMGRNLTKLRQAERELREALAEVQQLHDELASAHGDLEQQLTWIGSHDLQEPLRTMITSLGLLKRHLGATLDPELEELLGFATGAANRMRLLLRDVLRFARVGISPVAPELVKCDAVLESALLSLQPTIEQSGTVVTCDALPRVVADRADLTRLFHHLIDNAIKFRGEDPPRVHVLADQEEGEWVFSVRDNGLGIEPEYSDRIFGIFRRLHSLEEYPGTGIGLPICRRILDKLGGRIWVESVHGEGSTFKFTIPILPIADAQQRASGE